MAFTLTSLDKAGLKMRGNFKRRLERLERLQAGRVLGVGSRNSAVILICAILWNSAVAPSC